MHFWKMNGAGNDFIILDNLDGSIPQNDLPRIARTLCERHLSIGADGLMVVESSANGSDFKMRFYNSDGSEGEMCGNGARCICRYGYETGLAGETQTIETASGTVTGKRISARHYQIRLTPPSVVNLHSPVTIDGVTYDCAYVELGVPGLPHAVIPFHDLQTADEDELRSLGRAIRHYEEFPKGANVNFYDLVAPDTVYVKTFERGVEDFTYACGTGSGSVVTVLTLQGRVTGHQVAVHVRGGELIVDANRAESAVRDLYLTGPTNIVAKGEVTDEDLCL